MLLQLATHMHQCREKRATDRESMMRCSVTSRQLAACRRLEPTRAWLDRHQSDKAGLILLSTVSRAETLTQVPNLR